MTYITLVKG